MLMVVTNRHLCQDNFLKRLEQLLAASPAALLLREKDLATPDYFSLAAQVRSRCQKFLVPLIIRGHLQQAKEEGYERVHLSLAELDGQRPVAGIQVGVSVHSLAEARQAEVWGASWLLAGHVFPTDCKKNMPGRGIFWLRELCQAVSVPVWAIGGMQQERLEAVRSTGATGVCFMSGAMCNPNPREYLRGLNLRWQRSGVS